MSRQLRIMWVPLYQVLDQNIANWRDLPIKETNVVMRGWGQVRVKMTPNNRKYRGVLKLWEMSSKSILGGGQTIQDDFENRGYLVSYPRDRVVFMEGMGAVPIQFIEIQTMIPLQIPRLQHHVQHRPLQNFPFLPQHSATFFNFYVFNTSI